MDDPSAEPVSSRRRSRRVRAATVHETIVEDMHTTLKLIRVGRRSAYHYQTLAVGLVPDTVQQYLLQRRPRGLGAMQPLASERHCRNCSRRVTASSWCAFPLADPRHILRTAVAVGGEIGRAHV